MFTVTVTYASGMEVLDVPEFRTVRGVIRVIPDTVSALEWALDKIRATNKATGSYKSPVSMSVERKSK